MKEKYILFLIFLLVFAEGFLFLGSKNKNRRAASALNSNFNPSSGSRGLRRDSMSRKKNSNPSSLVSTADSKIRSNLQSPAISQTDSLLKKIAVNGVLQSGSKEPPEPLPLASGDLDPRAEIYLIDNLGLPVSVAHEVSSAQHELNERLQLGHNILTNNPQDQEGREIGEKAYADFEESMQRILGQHNYVAFSKWKEQHPF